MLAKIGGLSVMGSPEEIKRIKDIVENHKTTNIHIHIDKGNTPFVPEHIARKIYEAKRNARSGF